MLHGAQGGDFFRHLLPAIRLLSRLAFAASVVVVCVLSLLPADDLPSIDLWDKYEHFLAYGELAFLGLIAFPGKRWAIAIILFLVAQGALIEIFQTFVPGRNGDLLDLIANAIGLLIGCFLAWTVIRFVPALDRGTR